MKQKISTLDRGTVFYYGGERFVILDHLDTGVFVLLEQSRKSVPFNTNDGNDYFPKNNYTRSTLREEIEGPWLENLIEHGAKREDMVPFGVDLLPTDMSNGYGVLTVLAAPLTLWQYGKYKDIIPLNEEDWWWLVTPWSCPWLRSPHTGNAAGAWSVRTNGGGCSNNGCSTSSGVRPALVLNSELLVSLDGEDEYDTDGDCDNYSVGLCRVDTKTLAFELLHRIAKLAGREVPYDN